MKKVFKIFLTVFLVLQSFTWGQAFKVAKEYTVQLPEPGEHLFPRFSENDSILFFTKDNFKGIESYNLYSKAFTIITPEQGAGYDYQFAENGSKIFYRTNNFINGRKYSDIKAIDLKTNSIDLIENGKRNLSTPKVLSSGDCIYKIENDVTVKKIYQQQPFRVAKTERDTVLFFEDGHLILLLDGERKIFNLLGNGSYLWASFSPDKKKIVFTFMGKGTFVTDLEGNVLADLGYANAPKWSPDGKWLAYMVDKDNGQTLLSSDIFLTSADGSKKIQLTDTKDIHEQYPEWAPSMNSIVCHSEDGKIVFLELERKK